MTLRYAVEQYVAWRQDHGAKYKSAGKILYGFVKSVDEESNCDSVTNAQVCTFLAGNGPLTATRANKYAALAGFYRYAISRGYASSSPLPDDEPKKPQPAPPYIYSRDEICRLFDAIDSSRSIARNLDGRTFRTLLLLLYGAGLRAGEARRLTLEDVDVSYAVLTVRDTKFYKSRLVPVGPQLAQALQTYASLRAGRPLPKGRDSSFLANLDGTPLAQATSQVAFARLRRLAGIDATDGVRQLPRMHSFRHSFAVHRLTDWYREGADVQRLLPVLSTYLGHANVTGTQVYLSMTPELLQQASLRLERYVNGENNE